MLKLITARIGSMTVCFAVCWLASPGFTQQENSVLQPAAGETLLNRSENLPGRESGLLPVQDPRQADQAPKSSGNVAVQAAGDSPGDAELLTKGPLHEAFAELPQENPEPNPVVTRQPPEPVRELPPEYRPEGENVEWIPGYWAWDEDREDFLWISGIWRDLPPGQRWVPGYWNEEAGGVRWVSGFWMNDDVEEIEYLPAPPASLDEGPSTPAPSDSHFYAPGNWVYEDNDFVWRAGCWMPRVENWVWVQPCYVWTPRGCVFRAGYWDRLFDARGVVFAPVCYRRPIYVGVDYFFTPSCVIDTGYDLFPHLFVRRNCRTYFFGDWYDNRYLDRGFCAWSRLNVNVGFSRCHDPFFVYYSHSSIRYQNLGVVSWARNRFDYCYENIGFRPPALFNLNLNLISQRTIINGQPVPQPVVIADTLERRVKSAGKRVDGRDAFRQLAEAERRDFQKRSEPIQDIARERRTVERIASEQLAAERRSGRGLAQSGAGQPGVSDNPILRQAARAGAADANQPEQAQSEKLALPKVDRRQQLAAERTAAELKRQRDKDEQAARSEERRTLSEAAETSRNAGRKSGRPAGEKSPVLNRGEGSREVAGSDRLPNPAESATPRANRGMKLPDATQNGAVSGPDSNGRTEQRTPEQRREASAARLSELKAAQQARESARQQESAARELERQQRSTGRSNPLASAAGRETLPPPNPSNPINRAADRANRATAEDQQRQQRSAELLQRRSSDQAARQAAEQQRNAELAQRRQAAVESRTIPQQSNPINRAVELANRAAAEDQQRQQRSAELLQRRSSDQATRQAAEQQRNAELAQRRQAEAQQRSIRQQQEQQQRESRRLQDQMRLQQMQQQQQARESAARQQRDSERQQRDLFRQQQQQPERSERRRKG